ncbi:DMT family transporter [Variovorax rhizosphaerae]|uniref:DMT family transporter n=1 Tax=Variovorax rhizosphaerae TaxID=1836200 RepID=A0ABU8WSZ4_9BURK
MALYNVSARPLIARSGPVAFSSFAMAVGALCLALISASRGGFASVAQFGSVQWAAIVYLGIFGGAIGFFLWAYALERTTPTRVAVSVTVNPVTAALFGAFLLGEPIGWNHIAGLLAVLLGIWVATTGGRTALTPR